MTINDENRLKIKVEELSEKSKDNEYVIKARLQEKDEEVKEMKEQIFKIMSTLNNLVDQGSRNKLAKDLYAKGIYQTE